MYGRSVFELWVEKYGEEEAYKRALRRSKKLSEKSKGKNNPMYGKSPSFSSGTGKSNIYNNTQFRSTWEVEVAKWLDSNDIKWKYELERYKLSNDTTYLPDFFIFENGKLKKIIEVKGFLNDTDREKIELFRQEYKIDLELWESQKMKELKLLR